MAYINTEIVRKQSPIVEVADSMTAFIKNDLKLNTDGRTIRQVKKQLASLAGCTMSVFFGGEETNHVHVKGLTWLMDTISGSQSLKPNGYSGTVTLRLVKNMPKIS